VLSAAQFAVTQQVPVPLVMVTVLPAIEQAAPAVITAVVLALVVAETANVELYAALAGAPVKVTVGVTNCGPATSPYRNPYAWMEPISRPPAVAEVASWLSPAKA
jgi:hypothetical protein